jgi:hypothetical protein
MTPRLSAVIASIVLMALGSHSVADAQENSTIESCETAECTAIKAFITASAKYNKAEQALTNFSMTLIKAGMSMPEQRTQRAAQKEALGMETLKEEYVSAFVAMDALNIENVLMAAEEQNVPVGMGTSFDQAVVAVYNVMNPESNVRCGVASDIQKYRGELPSSSCG